MTSFEIVDSPLDENASGGAYCWCMGAGPWDVSVAISGTPEDGVTISFIHAACEKPMVWVESEEIAAYSLPLRMTVESLTDRGPDNKTWFELTVPEVKS